ncbi:ATP-binding cassette domain-containing protein [Paenibacillus thailandensis]|uniref:ATP-binding cassette domain-containing protein n=1 Tax=Paenibacillus thailandensis TaxID=393250 RepID=A0ABW5R083_9BACL
MSMDGLAIRGIHKTFDGFQALQDVNVHIPKGKFTCLLGPSGCGKTTLLRIISGLEEADSGQVMLNGVDITPLPSAKRNFGIVFQSYALFPNLTVRANVGYGLKGKLPRRQAAEKVKDMLELVGLENAGDRYPSQLSGGQQQRVALARALAMSPEVLLLDEPLSALDAKVREKLREQLRELQERLGITTVMVTHDQEEALTMADRIVVMDHGRVMQCGMPQEVYAKPGSPFVADFIGAVNFLEPRFVSGTASGQRLAIRPEHVEIAFDASMDEENVLSGFVKNVEFRGSFYRISLQLNDRQGERTDAALTVDVDSATGEKLAVSRHLLLKLRLPEEKLLRYEDGHAAG